MKIDITFQSTRRFSIAEYVDGNKKNLPYSVTQTCNFVSECDQSIHKYGFVILKALRVDNRFIEVLKMKMTKLIEYIRRNYDPVDDSFSIDMEQLNIVRMPRIGNGKHNFHFDPYLSSHHRALYEFTIAAGFQDILSSYFEKACTLRESGISITRPSGLLHQHGDLGGEGMEWHSDGNQGEATVLMSISDIPSSMGCLRIVPGSHRDYVDGVGHEEVEYI